jgi:CubicO group peptidase (beta-lactamase class C family)
VKLKDVLQMSTGVSFDEDYASFFSDINRMGRSLALGTSVQQFAASLKRESPPGTVNHYVSMDTQVLGCVLARAVGKPLTEYLEEKLWRKIGTEGDIRWMLDNERDRMELAFGTLNARTRDYARFGWLYLNEGRSPLDGSQVVPREWVRASVVPDGAHVQPGPQNTKAYDRAVELGYKEAVLDFLKEEELGYGYQWWIPGREDDANIVAGDYLAIGVYGQFIYVNPQHRIVIAMNSAYAAYAEGNENDSEMEAIALFRAISNHFSLKSR